MYLGVDVGGTKTLVAVLDAQGVIIEHEKFPTPKNYDEFLDQLGQTVGRLNTQDFKAGGIAIPGRIDRARGLAKNLGNLGWKNIPILQDLEILCHCPFVVENDAKLGGLSEAMLLKNKYHKILYVTVSTGIGIALVVDGRIDPNVGDGGGKSLMLEHNGRLTSWEEFAGGHAIVERYGKMARDITDEETWKSICRNLALGLLQLIAITEPEVIVIGGSVGTYFERYGKLLNDEIQKFALPMVALPTIVGAQRPEEAVVYGCYDLTKQVYGQNV